MPTQPDEKRPLLQPYGLPVEPGAPLIPAERSLVIEAVNHIAIRVSDIWRAEQFYREFFQMDLVLRAWRNEGVWEELPADYDWHRGIQQGIVADLVYLHLPPLALALRYSGTSTVFAEPRIDHISLRVSPGTLLTIRAQALVRAFAVTDDQPHSFIFRDPFGITWHITDSPGL